MKHGLKQRKLNRTSSHRLALLKNLSISLIKHETITTTTEKAKELRPFIEKLVTKAKNDNLSNRKFVLSKLFNNKEACQKLFNEISSQNKDRSGGYTRIIKKGNRFGDFAHTSIIQFVK
jgi:large subunit ribosomal protein L17